MKKTRYYLKLGKQVSTPGFDENEWFCAFGIEFIKANNVKIYLDKKLNKLYCYEKPTKFTQQEWGQSMYSLHSPDLMIDYEEEVEIEEKTTKLKRGPVKGQLNWKSSNRGGGVRLKPTHATKTEGPIRQYKKVKEDGFTRLNKPKNGPPKGTIVGIFTGV